MRKNNNYKKKSNKKRIILIVSIIIVLFIATKIVLLKIYDVDNINDKHPDIYSELIHVLKNPNEIIINYNQTDKESFQYEGIIIRNDFNDYELIEDKSNSLKYVKKNNENEVIESIWIGTEYSYLDYIKSDFMPINEKDELKYTNTGINKVLKDNNITNDVELFKYLSDNYYFKNTLFTPITTMKVNRDLNNFVLIMSSSMTKYYIIKGDYEGYIFEYPNNIKEVNIFKDNKRYVITFVKCDENYIKDLISSIEFK